MNIETSEFDLNINDRHARAYAAVPEGGGPAVLVLHAWWGLKPSFKRFCDRLAEAGFIALAPDLYQGRTADTVEEANALLRERDNDFMILVVEAAANRLKDLTGRDFGVMGFSMGAAWALEAAANEPAIKAVVLFYGVNAVEFDKVQAQVQGHFAEVDEWEPLDGVHAMEADMQAAGLGVDVNLYPGTHHWFMEEDRPEYDPEAAGVAWRRTLAFLRETLT